MPFTLEAHKEMKAIYVLAKGYHDELAKNKAKHVKHDPRKWVIYFIIPNYSPKNSINLSLNK